MNSDKKLTVIHWASFSIFALALFAAPTMVSACSNQSVGQACSVDNLNDDCDTESGLVCVSKSELGTDVDLCCPSDLSDPACTPRTPTTGATTGTGGAGGGGGMGGAGGAGGAAGTPDGGL